MRKRERHYLINKRFYKQAAKALGVKLLNSKFGKKAVKIK